MHWEKSCHQNSGSLFLALTFTFTTVKNWKIMIIKLSFLGNILFINCLVRRLLSHFITSASTPVCEKRYGSRQSPRRGGESRSLPARTLKNLGPPSVCYWMGSLNQKSFWVQSELGEALIWSFPREVRPFLEICMHHIRGISARAFLWPTKQRGPCWLTNILRNVMSQKVR